MKTSIAVEKVDSSQSAYKVPAMYKGYFNYTSVSFGLYYSDEPDFAFNISTVNGYRFSKNITLGVGIGYCYMHNGFGTPAHFDLQILPLYVDFKLDFTKRNASPFWFLDIGTTIPISMKGQYWDLEIKKAWPGLYLGTGLGVRVYVHHSISVNPFLSVILSTVNYESQFPSQSEPNPDDGQGRIIFLFGMAVGF